MKRAAVNKNNIKVKLACPIDSWVNNALMNKAVTEAVDMLVYTVASEFEQEVLSSTAVVKVAKRIFAIEHVRKITLFKMHNDTKEPLAKRCRDCVFSLDKKSCSC